MKYIFIENPVAGNKAGHDTYNRVKQSLISNPDCEFYLTEHPTHATAVARDIARKYGTDAVIFACGGDGTLSEVATGARGFGSAIALLPMGTGNDFAKKIYGDMSLEEIARGFGLCDGKPNVKLADIDCIEANGVSCLNVMSLGFDTTVLKIANKISETLPFFGGATYKLALVASLFKGFGFKAKFEFEVLDEAEDITFTDDDLDFTLAAICNGSFYGGGFCPARDSILDDGKLDVVIAKKLNLIQVAGMIGSYSKGTILETHPHLVSSKSVVGGKISSIDGKPLSYNCDGNVFEAKTIDFKVIRNGFTLGYFENEALLKAVNLNEQTKSRL